MLNAEDNLLLTRVGPGTPMGELFRRFWLPALLSEEIERLDSPPVRLRILCEDLLAFRNSVGRVGIVDAYCSHRGAPLFFGRNEESGLRCPYHGWKFDVDGRCVDIPNTEGLQEREKVRDKLGIGAYPVREAGGVVWVYMGPRDLKPELPGLEWLHVPKEQCHASRWLQRSNWLQGAEGEIDTSHISFLHKDLDPATSPIQATGANLAVDGAPEITVRETDYGFASAARRRIGSDYFWRISQWLAPMYSLIPTAPIDVFTGAGGRAWVPIDDDNTVTFAYRYRVDRPLNHEEFGIIASGEHFPPRTKRSVVRFEEGHPVDLFVPEVDIANDYQIDRQLQRNVNYTGIRGVSAQDRSVQEGMRPAAPGSRGTVDRTREHLVGSDRSIVTARRRLLKLVRDLQKGIEPLAASNGAMYGVRAVSRICGIAAADEFIDKYSEQAVLGTTEEVK